MKRRPTDHRRPARAWLTARTTPQAHEAARRAAASVDESLSLFIDRAVMERVARLKEGSGS